VAHATCESSLPLKSTRWCFHVRHPARCVAADLADVELSGEMGTEGVALVGVHTGLEKSAEDFGFHEVPFPICGGGEQVEFGGFKFNGIDVGEQTAVEVGHIKKAPTARRHRVVHLAEQSADEVIGVLALFAALCHEAGQDLTREEVHVLGNLNEDLRKDHEPSHAEGRG
jgi:hypothetical protein